MNRIIQAFRVFFRILGDAGYARQLDQMGQGEPAEVTVRVKEPAVPAAVEPVAARPRRSEAITLLATLQREGRLVDFLQESIEGYTDAQIGAAVRDIHRGCKAALERMFKLAPVMPQPEGSPVRVEGGYDPGRVRLTGKVAGSPPYAGKLYHPGWQATQCELADWTGNEATAKIVAPAEVEIA